MIKEEKSIMYTKKEKTKTIILVFGIPILLILLLFFGTKTYLILNLLLGNDMIIKVNANKENFFLLHDRSEEVSFKIYALTNPFCDAECVLDFVDLSNKKTIESSNFKINPTKPAFKQYLLSATQYGEGQELYRFDIKCKSIKSTACRASDEIKTKSIIITLNYYLSEEEQNSIMELKEKISLLIQQTNYLNSNLNGLEMNINISNETLDFGDMKNDVESIKYRLTDINEISYSLKDLWESEEYSFLHEKTENASNKTAEIGAKITEINNTLNLTIFLYNSIIDNLTAIKNDLQNFMGKNVTSNSSFELENIIEDYNNLTASFSEEKNLSYKEFLINNMSGKIQKIKKIENQSENTKCCFVNETLDSVNASKLQLIISEYEMINITFKNHKSKCCYLGQCEKCCDECSDKSFPIIFLHGHSFNKAISAEYSLDVFNNIQRKLEKDGYINAGSILLSDSGTGLEGIWGKTNYPISVTASYYFDIYREKEKGIIIQTKKDSLDTYAIRLRDIINTVKYKTDKNKIIIVAHSMGGLVVRRYMQIFGSNDIEKLILIGTPNKGIEGGILNYCYVFGSRLECNDMNKESLFVNKINMGGNPNIPVYNIIGIGCKMGRETGDGVVKNSSAYLEGAKNYFVSGACEETRFKFLHEEILDTEKYPEVYSIINESLKKNDY